MEEKLEVAYIIDEIDLDKKGNIIATGFSIQWK